MSIIKQQFNFANVDDFDKHIALSIPDYSGLANIFRAISVDNIHPNGKFYDLGCSTGKFLQSIPRIASAKYIGVDVCDLTTTEFDFIKGDAAQIMQGVTNADVVVVMFLLQFMGRHDRSRLIKELVRLNKECGTVILISEKIYINNVSINQILHREHQRQKRLSFSDKEIMDKDYQLTGSMFCLNEESIEDELSQFNTATPVWQSYNFKGWCLM